MPPISRTSLPLLSTLALCSPLFLAACGSDDVADESGGSETVAKPGDAAVPEPSPQPC